MTNCQSNEVINIPEDKVISLREALRLFSKFEGQGFKKCFCKPSKSQCHNNKCLCFKSHMKCTSKCHKSGPCCNKSSKSIIINFFAL